MNSPALFDENITTNTKNIYDLVMNNPESEASKCSWTFWRDLLYGFIVLLIFTLTIGVPSVAVFLGIQFLPSMILWTLSDVWMMNFVCASVPVLCTALASGILIGCIYGARTLLRYLSKLSYEKNNEESKLENPTKCNWFKRVLAFFGCIAFGLSTVIFPVCILVLAVDALYVAVWLIVFVIYMLCFAARGGGGCDMPSCGSCFACNCVCDCSVFDLLPGSREFYYCWKIVTTGENPIYKNYSDLHRRCYNEVNKLLENGTVTENCLDELLNNAKGVDSLVIEELRSEIVKVIFEKKIIPLVVVLAIKQNKSVKKIFGLQIENQHQCTLNCKSFWAGVKKLLNGANKNKQDNQSNLDESSQLPSKAEIEKVNQTENMGDNAAPNILQINRQDQITINEDKNNNNISKKTKHNHNIDVNCNDEDGKKLRSQF